ncbi:MAG TPA: acyclic terpene utilization AtuA family protein, partial [Thermodesulfobacteriota bacterium]|nr:acyclic terpene utilization AtuA family protein [Thermodesulfobacteriota bacterium]
HLLECGAQVTGGYFADPGFKDVPEVAWVGFPIAEMESDGRMVITKAAQTGGLVSKPTVIEQILYEIHDPSAYLTPDVVLDITNVTVHEIGKDRVSLQGAQGKTRPDLLKATLGFEDGWLGEGEISYAGPNAVARAHLALSILKERIKAAYPNCHLRGDIIGACSLFNDDSGAALHEIREDVSDIRARVAVHSLDLEGAEIVRKEVTTLYCCGPAGGGGIRASVTPRIATASAFIPREMVKPQVSFLEIHDA